MNSILQRIKEAQSNNAVLNKIADGGVITDESTKSAGIATEMVEGAENIPDVTKDDNSAPIAEVGTNVEKAGETVTPAIPVNANEDNPAVQEILDTAETVIKTANALFPIAQAFNQLSIEELDTMFNKQASAELTDDDAVNMINKLASAGNPIACAFVDYCNGYAYTLSKIANDAEALIEQGVAPEEAEALAAQAAMGGEMSTDVPEEVATEAGAELEAAVAEITAEAAQEIMEVVPEASPEEAQALAEELVNNKLVEELSAIEGMEQTDSVEGMEQTASAEEPTEAPVEEPTEAPAEEPVEVPNEAVAEAEEVVNELIMATAEDIKAEVPEVSDEEAIELATEAVMDAVSVAQEQEAIGATAEDGSYIVPDEVAADSIEDMIKTASANPLRDALTPVVATLFNINQADFINRISK